MSSSLLLSLFAHPAVCRDEVARPSLARISGGTDGAGAWITKTASFDPIGLRGLLYWYGVWPIHELVFRRMVGASRGRRNARSDKSEKMTGTGLCSTQIRLSTFAETNGLEGYRILRSWEARLKVE